METIFNMINVIDLPLKDAKLLKLNRHLDQRGWFTETFRQTWLEDIGIFEKFVFEYWSYNTNISTIRGLHAQTNVAPQSKLIQVLNGSIQDVLVDARQDSPTYGKYCDIILNSIDPCLIYIPKGFYHGFITLEPNTYVGYKLDNYHEHTAECGIIYNSLELDINWKIQQPVTISQRDQHHPKWEDAYKF